MRQIVASRWWPILRGEIGCLGPLWVRTRRFEWGVARPLRILYASDLHLGHPWTARVPSQVLAACRQIAPDYLLLGGDLIDRRRALPALGDLIRGLADTTEVHAIAGNHDRCVDESELADVLRVHGGHWLTDRRIDAGVAIDGRIAASTQRTPRILCAHDPSDFPNAVVAGYRLVLAGHLHGGQCVWFVRGDRLYPAIWFHRWHGLRFDERGATMLVSRGVADTLPVRWNCPREVILCEIV